MYHIKTFFVHTFYFICVGIVLCDDNKTIKNCIEILHNIHHEPLLTTNCCLTKLCSNYIIYNKVKHEFGSVKELIHKLCTEKFYLKKEQIAGCKMQKQQNKTIYNFNNNNNNNNKEIFKRFSSFPKGIDKIQFQNVTKPLARISNLFFLDIPHGKEMHIHNIRVDEEFIVFGIFSTIIGYLFPNTLPIELLRGWLEKSTPSDILILQVLKIEIGIISWIIFWAIISLILPIIITIYFCCPSKDIHRLHEVSSNMSVNLNDKYKKRTLTSLMYFFLLMLLVPLGIILAANEQISRFMNRATPIVDLLFEDLETFIKNTHLQLSFVATSSMDITIEAVRQDLENVEVLLGKTFQDEVAAETSFNNALNDIDNLKLASGKVTLLVSDLLVECSSARVIVILLQEKLKEISKQLTIIRQQCKPKDRSLCFTLQYTNLDVTFSCDNLTSDLRIIQFQQIGTDIRFNKSIENVREIFSKIPEIISSRIISQTADIKRILTQKRTQVYKSAHSLDELALSLTDSIKKAHNYVLEFIKGAINWDLWRWMIVLGVCAFLLMVWGLLLCGAPCGCGHTSKTIPFLLSGIILLSLIILLIWCMGVIFLLIGGHGILLVYQPLHDQPQYTLLSELLDSGGIFYNNIGIFEPFSKQNDSLKIKNVLRNWERNHPAFGTFHLNNIFEINSLLNHKTWTSFQASLSNLSIGGPFEILSTSLQSNLHVLTSISTINLTEFRSNISEPVTKRDLNSFADQLNTVSRQLDDLIIEKKMIDLALMIRRIIQNEVRMLNDLQNKILYKITALDVLMHPLNRLANHSLAQLKSIQYFFDNDAWLVAEKNSQNFISRIESQLNAFYSHASFKMTKELGKTRPLWEIFYIFRLYLCNILIDSMNAISLSSFLIIFIGIGMVPVVLKLIKRYKGLNDETLISITHRRSRNGLTIDEEGTWITPTYEITPPTMELRHMGCDEDWGRSSSPPLLTRSRTRSPIRLSTITSRISVPESLSPRSWM